MGEWTLGPRTMSCCANLGTPLSLSPTVCEEGLSAQTTGAPGLSSSGPTPKAAEEGERRQASLPESPRPQPHPHPSVGLFAQL